jgi:homoserine kinase
MRVRAPATTANLGPGFDSLGLALQLYNELEVVERTGGVTEVEVSGEGAGAIPTDESNAVLGAMRCVYQRLGRPLPPVYLRQTNAILLARGLGSSAAATAAGIVAANALAGYPFGRDELVDMATAFEGHPDNITPCLVGGLAVSAMEETHVYYAPVEVPEGLAVVLYVPDFEISTRAARRHLSETYSRADAIFTLSRAALTTAALATGRWDLLRIGMQDCMHQPYRARGYPEMPHLIQAALDAGARGAALSGSGPTIAAFVDDGGQAVAAALQQAGTEQGLRGRVLHLAIDRQGTVVEDE